MRAVITSTNIDTQSTQADIDAASGYPRDGVNVGGGIHCPSEQSRALHAQGIAPLKDGTFAVFADALPQDALDKLTASDKAAMLSAKDLDPAMVVDSGPAVTP